METLIWVLVISGLGAPDIHSWPMNTVEQCIELRTRALGLAMARNDQPLKTYSCVQFRSVK